MIEEITLRMNQKLDQKIKKCDLLIPFKVSGDIDRGEEEEGFILNAIPEFWYQVKFLEKPIFKAGYRYSLRDPVFKLENFTIRNFPSILDFTSSADRILLENIFTMLQIGWMVNTYNKLVIFLKKEKPRFIILDWSVHLLKFLGFDKEVVLKLLKKVLEAGKFGEPVIIKDVALDYAFLILGDCLFFDEMFNDEALLNCTYKHKLDEVIEKFELNSWLDTNRLEICSDIVCVVDAFVDKAADYKSHEDDLEMFENYLLKAFDMVGQGHYLVKDFLELLKIIANVSKGGVE